MTHGVLVGIQPQLDNLLVLFIIGNHDKLKGYYDPENRGDGQKEKKKLLNLIRRTLYPGLPANTTFEQMVNRILEEDNIMDKTYDEKKLKTRDRIRLFFLIGYSVIFFCIYYLPNNDRFCEIQPCTLTGTHVWWWNRVDHGHFNLSML